MAEKKFGWKKIWPLKTLAEKLLAEKNSFPLVEVRKPVTKNPDNDALEQYGGLENRLGMEMLKSYFVDAGVQAGVIPAPDRTYLGVLGSTYVANLSSFRK